MAQKGESVAMKAAKIVGSCAALVVVAPIAAGAWVIKEMFKERPYQAKDGHVYPHKESTWEYNARHRDNEERERERRERKEAADRRREDELRKAEEDLVRAKQGYKPGEGYIASNGIVYPRKETPEECHQRRLSNLRKEADRALREHERGKGKTPPHGR